MCLGLGRAQESPGIEGKAPIWGYRIPPPPSPPSAVLGMWLLWTHTALSACKWGGKGGEGEEDRVL